MSSSWSAFSAVCSSVQFSSGLCLRSRCIFIAMTGLALAAHDVLPPKGVRYGVGNVALARNGPAFAFNRVIKKKKVFSLYTPCRPFDSSPRSSQRWLSLSRLLSARTACCSAVQRLSALTLVAALWPCRHRSSPLRLLLAARRPLAPPAASTPSRLPPTFNFSAGVFKAALVGTTSSQTHGRAVQQSTSKGLYRPLFHYSTTKSTVRKGATPLFISQRSHQVRM